MIDVDGSSDISFPEFRRFAILLPKSQVSLSMTKTLFLQCQSNCGLPSIAQSCLSHETDKQIPIGALLRRFDFLAFGVAVTHHQSL